MSARLNFPKKPLSLRDCFRGGALICGATLAQASAVGAVHGEELIRPRAHETVIVTGQRAGSNPYGDAQAPYRIVESANDLIVTELNDTPKSISVLPEDLLADMGVTSLRDVFRSQPGITLGTGEGGNAFGDRIFIRGYDARNDIYIDGARDPGVGSREVFAVQQIEITKGPSSTFGGRGTTGGTINLVSKKPGRQNRTSAEFTLGTQDQQRATLDTTHNFADSFAVRLNLMAADGGVAGRDYVFNKRWGAALSALWRPSDKVTVSLDYYHLTTEYLPDWGLPWDPSKGQPFGADRSNFYGVLARDYGESFADVYALTGDYQVSDTVKLKTTLKVGQGLNAYTASAPEQPDFVLNTVRANAKRRDAVTDYITSQSSLTWPFKTGTIEHTIVAGYELARETTLNRQRAFTECASLPCSGLLANPTLSLSSPNSTLPWSSSNTVTARPVIRVDTAAIYAVDSLVLSPKWLAMIGVRADTYKARTKGLAPDREARSDFVNGQLGLVYKPAEWASIYASFGTASNPPCEQLDATTLDYGGCDQRIVERAPVQNTTWEVGGKFNVGGHIDVTGAFFTINRTDVPILVGSGALAIVGDQDQQVLGAEFTVAGNVTEVWSLAGGVTVLDTEVTQSAIPAQVGLGFPNVAELSFTLTSRYKLSEKAHIGGTIVSQGSKSGGTAIAGVTRLPGFTRFDVFGGFALTKDIEVRFNALNVTDEVYYDALYRSSTPFTYIAPGRSFSVTLDWHF